MPSFQCYVLRSVELLGPTTPNFQTWAHDPQFSNQIDTSVHECMCGWVGG